MFSQRIRDKEKQQRLKENEISLVPIKHNWNGTWSQLKATIKRYLPQQEEEGIS
jgi:hypothetical protein